MIISIELIFCAKGFLCWLHDDCGDDQVFLSLWRGGVGARWPAALLPFSLPSRSQTSSSVWWFSSEHPVFSFCPSSQSNYWSSCISCQRSLTWPCRWGGSSAQSWCSPWWSEPAPSFSMMEKRFVLLHFYSMFFVSLTSTHQQIFVPLLDVFSALLTLNCSSSLSRGHSRFPEAPKAKQAFGLGCIFSVHCTWTKG